MANAAEGAAASSASLLDGLRLGDGIDFHLVSSVTLRVVVGRWLLLIREGRGGLALDVLDTVPDLEAAAAGRDPEVKLHLSNLGRSSSLSRLEQPSVLDIKLELVGLGVDLEIELEGASLAAGDREEVVGLVVGLDEGLWSRVVVFGLADDLELFRSVRRDGLDPLVSLPATMIVSLVSLYVTC